MIRHDIHERFLQVLKRADARAAVEYKRVTTPTQHDEPMPLRQRNGAAKLPGRVIGKGHRRREPSP